ncbi:soma ferritin-like [Mytilus galloprovincialis]|uniref:soma ferritin-like n=1 Tax=Mytilus galloprovincialis TaxID=29158 RepID=UPI003F7C3048
MQGVIGLLVGVAAVFAFSASGWLYSPDEKVSVIEARNLVNKLVEQNFDSYNQRAIRKQITECFRDSYQYLAMSMYFDQAEVALPGFHKLFKEYSDREMSNAAKLMTYMNLREGSNKFIGIPEPKISYEWHDGETALISALRMEHKANTKFQTIIQLALEKHDPHLKQFIEDSFLDQKVKVIKELGDKVTQLGKYRSEGKGLGLQMFDNTLL